MPYVIIIPIVRAASDLYLRNCQVDEAAGKRLVLDD